jgi:alpha-glucosidase (family GH31 glycosyl hydrolase)
MKKTLTVEILDNEYWYGGAVNDGYRFPIGKADGYSLNIDFNDTYNQINPVFLSSKGRYIWLDDGGEISFGGGKIDIRASGFEIWEDGTSLRDAAKAAAARHYPSSGKMPPRILFEASQYCSWIALDYRQNQDGILSYARSIIDKGLKPGVIILDDCWQEDYGVWEFNCNRFPDPDKMVARLKEMGFSVILWLVPYVSADSSTFRQFEHTDFFIRDSDGKILLAKWWNGYSAVLDLSRQKAVAWLKAQTDRLTERYGVAGFKLDGGDSQFLGKTYADGNLQNYLWINGVDEKYIREARACYKLAGTSVVQRLADKAHVWGIDYVGSKNFPDGGFVKYGLSTVIPNMLTQGLVGYAFGCPDMVGGGLHSDFTDKERLDSELLIRSCQACSLMPMIQFSYDVWNVERDGVSALCLAALKVRERLIDCITGLAKNAAASGEPVVRYMEYEFPGQNMERITSQFMLGSDYLVAPVTEKGVVRKKVYFPKGRWRDISDGRIYTEGAAEIEADISVLPVFQKI